MRAFNVTVTLNARTLPQTLCHIVTQRFVDNVRQNIIVVTIKYDTNPLRPHALASSPAAIVNDKPSIRLGSFLTHA